MVALRRARTNRARRKQQGLKIAQDLKRAETLMDKFSLTPTTQYIDQNRSSEVNDILARRKAEADRAQTRDADAQALLETLQGGLGGLTSQENTWMRERGEQGLDRGLQTNLRSLAGVQRGSGVRGAAGQAGTLELLAERLMQGKNLERDIQLENIAVQDNRRNNYGSFLNNLLGTESANRMGTLNALEQSTGLARTDELSREMFNIGQQQSADALKNSTLFGLVGLRGGRRATKQAMEMEQKRIDLEREIAQNAQSAIMAQIEALKGM